MSEVLDQLKELGETTKFISEEQTNRIDNLQEKNHELKSRVEMLEANRNRPPVTVPESKDYKVLHTGGQDSFLVAGKGRLTDIPGLAKEKPPVSIDRWANALILGDVCEDREAIEFVHGQKSVTTGSTGALVPAGYVAEWIDMARAQSVLISAGMRTVPMNEQTLTWSHQTADPTFSWRSSEGASLSATDPTFASRTLTAKTIAVRTAVSLEATQDVPNFGEQISMAYAKAFGAAIDGAGIMGNGSSPQLILGLHNAAGVGTVTGVGTPTNWDEVLDGVNTFLNANNSLDELTGIIMHPNIWTTFAKLKTGISSDNTSLELPPSIANVPKFVTTNADTVTSPEDFHIVLGNFEDLVMGVRMNPTIRILDGTTSMASNLLVEIVGVARVDFLLTRPASFVRLEGVSS